MDSAEKHIVPLGRWKREAAEYMQWLTHATDEKAAEYAAELCKRCYRDYAYDPQEAVLDDLTAHK